MVKKGFIGAIVLAVILFGGVILGLMCTERIPAGYVGVVYNMNGGVDGEVLQQGWHLVSPTKKVTTYSIGIEQSYLTAESKGDSPNDESFNIPTSDGKTVRVNLEFSYRFDEERVAETFTMFKGKSGEEIKNTLQELELANIEAQTAKVQAEKEKEVAQIAAEKAIVEAEAKAEATRIAAEAEADANAQIAASLTPELIEKIKYEKWNGELPTVSGSNAIVSMEGLK